jgi:type I restriction enzyme S subunit
MSNEVIPFIEFGKIAEFRNGLNFSKDSHGTGCRLIGVADFQNNFTPDYDSLEEVNPEGITKDDDYLKKGDVLFVRSNGNKTLVGRSLYIDQDVDALFSGFCIRARLVNDLIDPLFLAYYTRTNHFKSSISFVAGTNINNLNQDILSNVKLPLYPKGIQFSITNVLSSIDEKLQLNNRINVELEAMAKTLHDYWFVQFDFPDKDGKPYKSSGGKMRWNDELKREIPDGWDFVTIESLLAKESHKKKILSFDILSKGSIPVIDQSTDFIAGFTNDDDAIIKTNEPRIIFGDHTRILKLINFDFARGADGTQIILSNSNRMPQHLFFHTLSKIDLSNYGYARHFKFLKETQIILPTEDIAKKYETIAKCSYEKIKQGIFENQRLAQLRDWLLPMLMNGQVTVKGEEAGTA